MLHFDFKDEKINGVNIFIRAQLSYACACVCVYVALFQPCVQKAQRGIGLKYLSDMLVDVTINIPWICIKTKERMFLWECTHILWITGNTLHYRKACKYFTKESFTYCYGVINMAHHVISLWRSQPYIRTVATSKTDLWSTLKMCPLFQVELCVHWNARTAWQKATVLSTSDSSEQ